MGKGGQIAQLENIEHVQTQNPTKVSKLVAATANELLNAMALMAINARARPSKDSSGNTVWRIPTPLSIIYLAKMIPQTFAGSQMHPSGCTAPLPAYQASTEGSCYGFNLPVEGKSLQELLLTALRSQASLVSVAASCGSFTPTLHEPTPHAFNAIPPCSRSRTPSSRGGSMAPTSQNGSMAPTSRSGSATRVSGMSSQVLQRVRLPLTRTYSAHSLEEMICQSCDSFVSEPPPYGSCNNDNVPDDGSENLMGSQLHQADFAKYQPNEPFIDEISPDEDELVAKKVLQGEGSNITPWEQHILTYILEPNGLPNVCHIPNDSDIGECSCVNK